MCTYTYILHTVHSFCRQKFKIIPSKNKFHVSILEYYLLFAMSNNYYSNYINFQHFARPLILILLQRTKKVMKLHSLILDDYTSSSVLQFNIISSQYFKTEILFIFIKKNVRSYSYIDASSKSLVIHGYSGGQTPSLVGTAGLQINSSGLQFLSVTR